MDSILEIISNAVCHRSYLTPGSIQIEIYDDRVEVVSSGRLSPDLTIDLLMEGNYRVKNKGQYKGVYRFKTILNYKIKTMQ